VTGPRQSKINPKAQTQKKVSTPAAAGAVLKRGAAPNGGLGGRFAAQLAARLPQPGTPVEVGHVAIRIAHKCVHAHTSVCIHTCIHTYIHTCVHAHTNTHTYTHIHTHTYTHIHTHKHTHTHKDTQTHTCAYIHTHKHIHTN
jgi:hypothetical protein